MKLMVLLVFVILTVTVDGADGRPTREELIAQHLQQSCFFLHQCYINYFSSAEVVCFVESHLAYWSLILYKVEAPYPTPIYKDRNIRTVKVWWYQA